MRYPWVTPGVVRSSRINSSSLNTVFADPAAMVALFKKIKSSRLPSIGPSPGLFPSSRISTSIVNDEPDSLVARFADAHGSCSGSRALGVKDASNAHNHALAEGVMGRPPQTGLIELNIPSIGGIRGSLDYLVDRCDYGANYEDYFKAIDRRVIETVSAVYSVTRY